MFWTAFYEANRPTSTCNSRETLTVETGRPQGLFTIGELSRNSSALCAWVRSGAPEVALRLGSTRCARLGDRFQVTGKGCIRSELRKRQQVALGCARSELGIQADEVLRSWLRASRPRTQRIKKPRAWGCSLGTLSPSLRGLPAIDRRLRWCGVCCGRAARGPRG